MKKLLALLLSVLLICSFAACKEEENQEETQPEKVVVNKFNFLEYEGVGSIEDVEKIALSEELSSACESYSFTYLSDDVRVKGYISIPLECIETERVYQCVVYNRGGNFRIGLLGDEDTAKICKETNRVVIASQYRGSEGSEGKDEFGGADLQDVISLIDLCENKLYFADITNLCMIGISRGGMMSYLAAQKDSRVKGIVAVSAVTDLADAYYARDDIKEMLHETIGGSPEELPEEYAKRSAINFVEELDVPVFIIHNKGDEMVPFSQAEAMNEKLKTSKHGCSMIIHNDSVHGLHENDIYSIVEWIDQALPQIN